MTNKDPNDMDGTEALLSYGYVYDDHLDIYRKARSGRATQMWRRVQDGWERYDPPTATMALGNVTDDPTNGAPWGRPLPVTIRMGGDAALGEVIPGAIQVPWKLLDKYEGVSGLHPAIHDDHFEWIWPDAEVAKIYAHAYTGEHGQPWHKERDGSFTPEPIEGERSKRR